MYRWDWRETLFTVDYYYYYWATPASWFGWCWIKEQGKVLVSQIFQSVDIWKPVFFSSIFDDWRAAGEAKAEMGLELCCFLCFLFSVSILHFLLMLGMMIT